MVVYDGHAVHGGEEIGVLDLLGPVRVHDDEEAAPVGREHGLLGRYEGVLILGLGLQALYEQLARVLLRVYDYLAYLALLAGYAADGGVRADGVEVGVLVAHDEDARGIRHQLGEGVRHDAALDLRARLDLAAAPAEELEGEAVLYDRLVAAAGEGHLRREGGELPVLAEALAVAAYAEGERRVYARGARDRVRALEYGELVLAHLLQMPLLEDDDVPVAVVAADYGVAALAVLVDDVLDGVAQVVLHAVGLAAHELVVVVYEQQRDDGAALLVLYAHVVVLRDVDPVGYAHEAVARALVVLAGADDVTVYLVLAPIYGEQARALGLALEEPLGGELGHQRV